MQPFLYLPLDRAKKQIRLFEITNLDLLIELNEAVFDDPELSVSCELKRALEDDVPIRGRISHGSLEDDFDFLALSYTWGEPSKKRRLIVDLEDDVEAELLITDSLNEALRNIRVQGLWWIDAVSINQNDDAEKSWQIQLMHDIFEKALYVAAWLGPAGDDSDRLIEQIADLPNQLFSDLGVTSKHSHHQVTKYHNWTPSEEALDLTSLWALMKRPYWQRVWIQQELQTFRHNVVLHCGSKYINMVVVSDAVDRLIKKCGQMANQGLRVTRRESYPAFLSAFATDDGVRRTSATLQGYTRKFNRGVKPKLAGLLTGSYIIDDPLKASDPRDRIYGLLGMSSDAGLLGIIPDYSKTTALIYAESTVALLKHEGLRVLTWSNFGSLQKSDPNLPSWVPDWTQPFIPPFVPKALKRQSPMYSGFRYAASKGLDDQCARPCNDFPKTLHLHLTGLRVDTVAEVGEPMTKFQINNMSYLLNDLDPKYEIATFWLKQIEDLSKHCGSKYGGHKGTLEAVWRVPITNIEIKERKFYKAPESMCEGYQLCRAGYLRATIPGVEYYSKTSQEKMALAIPYCRALFHRSSGRRFFVTEGGYLALGPAGTRKGDVVTIIGGIDCPIVIRATTSEYFQWLGEAYVHGIMDGEFSEMADESLKEEFTIG